MYTHGEARRHGGGRQQKITTKAKIKPELEGMLWWSDRGGIYAGAIFLVIAGFLQVDIVEFDIR